MPLVKILLAEDDYDDQKLFRDFLEERRDLQILPVVENGVELFEKLDKVNDLPDLIILDQNMPKLNGLQTLKELKNSARYAHIPVMVYSTYTDINLVNRCTNEGAVAVITKPLSKEGYHKMIDDLILLMKEEG